MISKKNSILRYIFFLIFLFFIIEIFCRFFFKEFNENLIFYDKSIYHRVSKGIDTYYQYLDLTEDFKFRVKDKNSKISFNKQMNSIYFVGDSVTNGYGVEYQDTYWNVVKLNLINKGLSYNVYNISNYGVNNLRISNILSLIFKEFGSSGDIFVYQFNYNDINDNLEDNIEISKLEKQSNLLRNKIILASHKIRYKYLNHSTFLKLLQHYARTLPYKTNGSCESRGIDALGPYIYAYFAKGYERISRELWESTFERLKILNLLAKENKLEFYVLISPISLQIKKHEKINKLSYDLNCATLDARIYLINFLNENNIKFIDPYYNFQKQALDSNILFHNFDDNHPNKTGHKIIGETIVKKIKFKK